MNFFKKISIILCTFVCALILSGNVVTYAASATINFGTDADKIKADKTFTVTIIIDSSDSTIGNVEARIMYDDDMLEVISSNECISGDAGLLLLNDTNDEEANVKNYDITFKALKKGSVTFKVSDDPMVYTYEDGEAMSVSSNQTTFTIGASAGASADSTLKSLDLNVGKLDPEFNSAVNAYTIHVPFETTKLYIDAKATDEKAKIAIVGNDNLKVGANNLIITVTAEDGSSTDYTISVFKEPEEEKPEAGSIMSVIDGKGFNVYEDSDGNEFIQNGVTYQVIELDDPSMVPSGYIKTTLNIYQKVSVTAYTLENDYSNDYMLIYCQNVVTKDTGFYQFDRVEKTLQRYSGVINSSNNVISQNDDSSFTQSEKMTIALVISVLSAMVVILLIVLVKLFIKIKGLKSDEID